jgi:2-polyprenyl-3-methyl-5-hydroxy-6-metoxy-1,4-benzoquinol methylase
MDEPDADQRMLENTYRRFGAVNALVSRPGLIYRRDIRPRAASGHQPLRILDVGAGGGDLCRYLVRRLRRDGLGADVTALDADDRAIRWASANDAGAGVRYRCARTDDLVEAGEEYDVVLSNHVLHHLTELELRAILRDSEQLAGANGLVSHHDIRRSAVAHALFAAGTWPFSRNLLAGSFIRDDGLTSIRRSFTAAELAALVPSGWSVHGGFPFRVELRWEGSDARP